MINCIVEFNGDGYKRLRELITCFLQQTVKDARLIIITDYDDLTCYFPRVEVNRNHNSELVCSYWSMNKIYLPWHLETLTQKTGINYPTHILNYRGKGNTPPVECQPLNDPDLSTGVINNDQSPNYITQKPVPSVLSIHHQTSPIPHKLPLIPKKLGFYYQILTSQFDVNLETWLTTPSLS